MFTAQSEIKHLATKELLSLLPNKCYLGSVPFLVDLKCFEKCYLALFTTQNEAYINGSHCRPLASALQQSYQKSDKFPPVFWRAFLKFENSKFCSSKPKQRRRRTQVFPIPIRSVRPEWAIYWTLVTF